MPIMIGLVFTSFLVVLYVDFLCVFLALCWAWASLLRSLYTYVVQHILKGSHFIIWSFLMILPFEGSIGTLLLTLCIYFCQYDFRFDYGLSWILRGKRKYLESLTPKGLSNSYSLMQCNGVFKSFLKDTKEERREVLKQSTFVAPPKFHLCHIPPFSSIASLINSLDKKPAKTKPRSSS